jgi:hypothetical protein
MQTKARFTDVAVEPCSDAAVLYRDARVAGFPGDSSLNLERYPGKTIEHMTFTNVYLGGESPWHADDVQQLDWALPAAMSDEQLNNVIAQYFPDEDPTTAFLASRYLDAPVPDRVYRDTIETIVASLDTGDADPETTVFCMLLPRNVVLVDGVSTNGDGVDSEHGLGGYHGSVHPTPQKTVYYAVGAFSEGKNGIAVFPEGWKNTCAVFYHELCEARTDPDVEDAIRAGEDPNADRFLGWYSPQGGEIGDIPLEEANGNLRSIVTEVPLTGSDRKVPVQLMWSNAVSGPEGPIATKHPFTSKA